MRRNASFLLQTVTASKAANVEALGLGSLDRHSVELEDFDLGLESAGDQGDDSFGELQRICGFSDCCVFVINGGFGGKFILAVASINRMVHGLNLFDIPTVCLRWQLYVRILMNVQFENCKWNTWLA